MSDELWAGAIDHMIFDSEGLMQLRTSVATEGADELSERRCQKIFAGLVHISRRCACSGDASGRLVV